ncbi:RNA polymerase factor sigma-54 [Leptothrix discophora]|uniref:RNA polymerase sigma-54 factor n=1 Tax=Leptothrix discophora TaxID=89 RepID=A0ABT9G5W3_LEPDI|nr:RNA polymerase factor sigma-54 [Leptothrix discophora]MDP4301800.1 RNA polymerase factor sigma-54 [Leptothrix discophora]
MKPSLQVRLSQHLALTPQLQQSIRLLQLSTLELHQEVEQMLEQNPFLEADEEAAGADTPMALPDEGVPVAPGDDGGSASASDYTAERVAESPAESASATSDGDGAGMEQLDFGAAESTPDDWDSGHDREDFNSLSDSSGNRNGALEDDDSDWSERSTAAPSLAEHLRSQLRGMRLADEDIMLVESLIDSLNEDGYLADRLEEIVERLVQVLSGAPLTQATVAAMVGLGDEFGAAEPVDPALLAEQALLREDLLDRLRCALGWLQSLEPTGVGARDLPECLVLQLRERDATPVRDAAIRICRDHLDLLARRDVRKLTVALGVDEDLIRDAQSLIVTLEPKPGRRFTRAEANIVVPDVIVQKSGRGWKVVLNPDVMPKLRINDMYAQVLRQHRSQRNGGGGDNGASLSARLQEARWFVKNILQRFDTIQRVSQAIVERQKAFFTHGEIAMKPLVLREIADELGLHESTISRVTTAKYMATPFGTFELKYFFGSSLNTEAGGNASSTAVRALIKQFVAAEDPKKPLSDSQLSAMLEEQGIQVARRTVAKYREALKIAPANLRKDM